MITATLLGKQRTPDTTAKQAGLSIYSCQITVCQLDDNVIYYCI